MGERLLNIEEVVAAYPYWRPRTLRAFVKEGTLACFRLGKRLYFQPSDIEDLIARARVPAEPHAEVPAARPPRLRLAS